MAHPVELSVSNICWPDGQTAHDEAMSTLAQLEVPVIDMAPTKVWPDLATGRDVGKEDVRDFLATLQGRRVAGFQSLTYGVKGSIFGDKAGVEALTERVELVIGLAEMVGATTIIYGSPGTRGIPEGMDRSQARDRAAEFFGPLAEKAGERGVILGIEPVSSMYIPNGFGASGREVDDFVKGFGATDRPAFVPDAFAMHHGGDDMYWSIINAAEERRLAPHWQVSERSMVAPGDGSVESPTSHQDIARALGHVAQMTRGLTMVRGGSGAFEPYDGPITLAIEMNPVQNAPVGPRLTQVVGFVRANYPAVG